jgi:hypothetical protein
MFELSGRDRAGQPTAARGTALAYGPDMLKTTWIAPEFEELELGPEIGTHDEERHEFSPVPERNTTHVRLRSRRRRGGRASLPPREVQ